MYIYCFGITADWVQAMAAVRQLYCTDKGKALLAKLGGEDKELTLLQKVLTKLHIH